MNSRLKIIMFTIVIAMTAALFFFARSLAQHPMQGVSLESQQFRALKAQADDGADKACNNVAKVYHLHEQYAEAIKYWECGIRKNAIYKSPAMQHFAGYYFHGFGVEPNAAKGAMYLILSDSRIWPKNKSKKLKLWLGHVRHKDISDIPDIEKKFKEGAVLAKEYIAKNNITDQRVTQRQIDKVLKRNLGLLQKVNFRIFMGRVIFVVFCIVLMFGVAIDFSKRRSEIV